MSARPGRNRSRVSQQEVYTLKNLEQVKVLADPLRIRVLEAFCDERTTKQVAELLDEKPTRLYHHVDALERVGLITLSRTRQNRGTVEKYYRAVARSFRADSRAFQRTRKEGTAKSAAMRRVMANIFDKTSAEVAALINGGEEALRGLKEEATVTFLEVRGSKAELDEFRHKLRALVAAVPGGNTADPGLCRYRLTLAFYPLGAGEHQGASVRARSAVRRAT